MKLGDPYRTVKFSEQSMMIVRSAISKTDLKWNEGILHNSNVNIIGLAHLLLHTTVSLYPRERPTRKKTM